MCKEIEIETWVAIAAVVIGVAISWLTIHYSNKNSRQQILASKLEEIFQAIQTVSRYYGIFVDLSSKLAELEKPGIKEIQTYEQYYLIRDQKLSSDDRNKISELLSRIEVLTECYTKGELKKMILKFESLMYSFFELVTSGGSIYFEVHWKNGFPDYEKFFSMVKSIKDQLIKEIKI